MKKALIHDAEPDRICEVHPTGFPVAPGLAWIDCADDVTPETHVWDGTAVVLRPVVPLTKEQVNAPILAQLERKDRLTDRRVREMVLRWAQSALPANDPDRIALEAREVEFAALRGTLTP